MQRNGKDTTRDEERDEYVKRIADLTAASYDAQFDDDDDRGVGLHGLTDFTRHLKKKGLGNTPITRDPD